MLLIYGAYGYTGKLAVQRAIELGLKPIIAGRDGVKLQSIAQEFGLEARTVGLSDREVLARALEGIAAVLHCAGPFSRTSGPMVDACLRSKVHYLDITGEVSVFEALKLRDEAAKAAGITVLPGVGFDVVPSDCLAQHLKSRLPTATHLDLGLVSNGGFSHGTMTTLLELVGDPALVRREGKLQSVPLGSLTREIDFGRGPRPAMALVWGDVSSAYHSTGIPNITVYWKVANSVLKMAPLLRRFTRVSQNQAVQKLAQRVVDSRAPGPDETTRKRATCVIWGEVRNNQGERRVSRLTTPEGYTFTAQAAVHIAQKVLEGRAPTGFHTPSTAFGADLALELSGVSREDL